MTRLRTPVLLSAALVLSMARHAHAYVDPTAGSMMLQLVLGGLAGLGIAVRIAWRRIASRFGHGDRPPAPEEQQEHPE